MTIRRRFRRPASILGLAFLLAAASITTAAETNWPAGRTTVPGTIEELKSLESTVKSVITKASPETVGLLIRDGSKTAAGSGVIVNGDGLILTAGHVAGEPGKTCTIILADGKRVKGKTLGRNDKLDSGMIQITDKGPNDGKWPHVELAKSSGLKEGQWVVTLGHPGGWREGRPPVARLGRVLSHDDSKIRTNCTIVGGDSGGPLFDLDGKLVGIHSRIGWSLTENVHVPTDAFVKDWDRMAAGDVIEAFPRTRPSRAILGVTFDEDAPNAKIMSVAEGEPAETAGIKAGDVITKFDGKAVDTAESVRDQIRKKKPGDEVSVEVKRDGKAMTFKVKLAARTP